MAGETPDQPILAAQVPATLESLDARLSALEAATASLGAISVTHTHDSFAKFREWFSAYLARVI
jgi:hypothetical protein